MTKKREVRGAWARMGVKMAHYGFVLLKRPMCAFVITSQMHARASL
jgi:hypothetical protein